MSVFSLFSPNPALPTSFGSPSQSRRVAVDDNYREERGQGSISVAGSMLAHVPSGQTNDQKTGRIRKVIGRLFQR